MFRSKTQPNRHFMQQVHTPVGSSYSPEFMGSTIAATRRAVEPDILIGWEMLSSFSSSLSWSGVYKGCSPVTLVCPIIFFFLCSSRLAAFSFHRTAYRERIEAVEKALTVIQKLSQYRPKQSANRLSGGLGLGPTFSEKQHIKALGGAPVVSRGNSVVNTLGSSTVDEYNTDVEDHGRERTLIGSTTRHRKRKTQLTNRPSWLNSSKEDDAHHADQIKEQGGKLVTPAVSVGDHTHIAESSNPHSSQHASEPNLIHSEPAQHHRYPPTVRMSSNGQNSPLLEGASKYNLTDSVPFKAAKVIKHAVLHDARNISGTASDFGALAWNVNSAHEAKVVISSHTTEKETD